MNAVRPAGADRSKKVNTLSEIADVLRRLKSAVIFTHMRPDGDALGSAMALHRALFMLNIRSEVVNEGDIPEKFLFLEGMNSIRRAPTIDAEAYICVDSSDEARLGYAQAAFAAGAKKGKVTVNIDHHISNTRFCKYNFVRLRASNCENIAELIALMGVKPDKLLASYLLTGMVTDSGAFSHSDVNGDTFRAAAAAADAGADVGAITYEVFKKQPKARAKLYAEVISKLRYDLDDRLVTALVTQSQLAKYGLKQDATEGIVDFGLSVAPVEVSVCMMEVKKGQYKASLRSKGAVNVNEVAGVFGGGGHVLASGCMFFGSFEEAYDRLRYAVAQRLPQ